MPPKKKRTRSTSAGAATCAATATAPALAKRKKLKSPAAAGSKSKKSTVPSTKKTVVAPPSPPMYIWRMKYEWSNGYGEDITEEALYSTQDKAIEAFPNFMDAHSMWGDDWRNGLEGFGKEDCDNYLGFEYLGGSRKYKNGGILLTLHSEESETAEVSLTRMLVDPPKIDIQREKEKEEDFGLGGMTGEIYF